MKNSPDHKLLHEFEKRIGSYEEEPDDLVWKNIDTALRPNRALLWFPWWDRATSGIIVLLFIGIYYGMPSGYSVSHSVVEDKGVQRNLSQEKQNPGLANNDARDKKKPDSGAEGRQSDVKPASGKAISQDEAKINFNLQKNLSASDLKANSDPFIDNNQEQTLLIVELSADSVMHSALIERDSLLQPEPLAKDAKRVLLKKLRFYANATPMLTFQRVIPAAMDGMVIAEFHNPSILSAERLGLSLSAGIQGNLSRRFEYYAGVSFYRQRKSLRYIYQSPDRVNVDTGDDGYYTISPKYSVGELNYNMLNVGAHAGFLFYLYGKKLSHKIGAGLGYLQGLRGRNTEVYKNSESSYLSYQLFYRNEISAGRRFKFFIQPTFTQAVQVNEKLDAPFKLKPYGAGIGLGILYDLK